MKVVLATILSQLDLALVTKDDIKPKRRGLVTGPHRPIEMVVTSPHILESIPG